MSGPTPGVNFQFEWEPGLDIAAAELAATWARLEIWVGSDCISQLEDLDSGSSRRSIYCSLYPLAEWAAYNWWFLRAHTRPAASVPDTWSYARLGAPGRNGHAWLKHHNLREAGDGYVWPDLTFLPEGQLTRIVWRADGIPPEHSRIRYIRQGEALVGSYFAQSALQEVIETTLTRLDEQGIKNTPLQQEWAAIGGASVDEAEFCLAAARLGLDPYDLAPTIAAQIERVGERVSPDLLDDFLDSIEADQLDAGLEWIRSGDVDLNRVLRGNGARLAALLSALPRDSGASSELPWEIGYAQARAVRETLSMVQTDPFQIEDYIAAGVHPFSGRGLQGLGARSGSGAGLLFARSLTRGPARFVRARALWHVVHEPERERFLITEARSARQRAERAFAAELLAPAVGIASYLQGEPATATQTDVEEVATHFGVSPLLVNYQIQNQLALMG